MALPTFVNIGTVFANAGTGSPGLPASMSAGDLMLCFVETANQSLPTTPTGYSVLGTPVGVGTAGSTGATMLTVYWKLHSGSESAPAISDSGNHQIAIMMALRGVNQTTPLGTPVTSTEASADTGGSITGGTTTGTDSLVLACIATDVPDSTGTAAFTGWTNSDLANLTERIDVHNQTANGGAIGVAVGEKATAGTVGATSVTVAEAAVKSMMFVEVFSPVATKSLLLPNRNMNPLLRM